MLLFMHAQCVFNVHSNHSCSNVDTTLMIKSYIMYNLLNVLATEPVPVIVFCKQIVVMLNQFLTI